MVEIEKAYQGVLFCIDCDTFLSSIFSSFGLIYNNV